MAKPAKLFGFLRPLGGLLQEGIVQVAVSYHVWRSFPMSSLVKTNPILS